MGLSRRPASRREAVARFITECGEAVKRAGYDTASGNCGMYAIGLSEFLLHHTNLKPTVAFLLDTSQEGVYPGDDVDHTHVFIHINGEAFDGDGPLDDSFESLEEVWSLAHAGALSVGWNPRNEETTRRYVRWNTDWEDTWQDSYDVLVNKVRVPAAFRRAR